MIQSVVSQKPFKHILAAVHSAIFLFTYANLCFVVYSRGDEMKPINPNVPDEYKYETDYRKIPSEYLNPLIPQGIGKVKWVPISTPLEQHERL